MTRHENLTKRLALRPIARRRKSPASSKVLAKAAEALHQRIVATEMLPELVKESELQRKDRLAALWENVDSAKALIRLVMGVYLARRFSLQEYVFMVAVSAEGIHDSRIRDKHYADLESLSVRMTEIEIAHGLEVNQYWARGTEPDEYVRLSKEWDSSADQHLGAVIQELEGVLAYNIYRDDPQEFNRLRERGRRSFFHKNEITASLSDAIVRYEREARSAADVRAYTAAITMLGAALEGLLLLRCVRSPAKSSRIASELPARKRPRDTRDPTSWGFDTLISVCHRSGWLPIVELEGMQILPDALAHILRQMRNRIHLGKATKESPWVEAERRDYEDAEVIFSTVYSVIVPKGKAAHGKRTGGT